GHIRAVLFRDLHRERTHTSGCAVNQDLPPRLNLSFVAKTLQRSDARYVDRSCLFKSDVSRFQCDCPLSAPTYILGEGPAFATEDIIAWFELRNILTDRFNCSGKINAQSRVLWFAQAHSHHAHDFWSAFDKVPVVRIDGSRPDLYQDLIVIRNRLFNVLKLEIT